MAGITLDESHPGYKQFLLQPEFSGKHYTYAKGSIESPYGLISPHWQADGGNVVYEVTVPPNTSAILTLPGSARDLSPTGDPTGKVEVDPNGNGLKIPLSPHRTNTSRCPRAWRNKLISESAQTLDMSGL